MKTRSSGPWLAALGCATVVALALAGPASAQHHYGGGSSGWHGGGGNWHGGGSGRHGGGSWRGGGWHGGGWHGGYGRGWGWGGVFIVPQPYNSCLYAYCYGYAPPPYRPYYYGY